MIPNFQHLTSTFSQKKLTRANYFVDWDKIENDMKELEIHLNSLNYLLGKENTEEAFLHLFSINPKIVKALPDLLAEREKRLNIVEHDNQHMTEIDFENVTEPAEVYYQFMVDTKLITIFETKKIKNLVDYVFGIQVGLSSNGRKNRTGKLMEEIVETYIASYCEKNTCEYLAQPNPKNIKDRWGIAMEETVSKRNFDFAVWNPTSKKLMIIETNLYNSGGSKLKATANEYKGLHQELSKQGITFVWVTEGVGWSNTLRPLEEAANVLEHICNLHMLNEGYLNMVL